MSSKPVKIFISDLHLGDGSRADDFHLTDEFLRFLDIIETEGRQLIIAGDLLELWQADLDKIVFYHNRIIRQLLILAREGRLVYLIGNHDHIPFVKYLEPQLNIQLEYKDEESGIWAEHGNQYDIFNRYKDPRMAVCNKWGRNISYLTGWAERIIHPDFDQWSANALLEKGGAFLKQAVAIKNKLTPSSKEYYRRGGNLTEYEEAARRLINSGRRIIIFGHTHQSALKELDTGIYANCGCWCSKEVPTYIRVNDDKIELVNGINHQTINSLELYRASQNS